MAAIVGLALGAAGCSNGQNAPVVKARTSINGVNVNLNDRALQIRNVYVTPTAAGVDRVAKGGSLQLHMNVFNEQAVADQLIGIQSIDGTVTLSGPGVTDGVLTIPPRRSVRVGYPDGPTAVLTGLATAKFVGTYVQLKLAFANAGTTPVLHVPIEDASEASAEAPA